jgi:hypothetical protein
MQKTFQQCLAAAAALALLAGSGLAHAQARKANPPAAPAPAAAKKGIGEGDTELGFFANYTTFDDIDSDSFLLGAVFGTFLSDSVQLRVTPVISFTDAAGLSMFNLSPYVTVEKLFAMGSPVVPYVGGGLGLNVGFGSGQGTDIVNIGLFLTPVAGLKFFVSERMALEYALSLQGGFLYNCVSSDSGYSECNMGESTGLNNTLRFNIYY